MSKANALEEQMLELVNGERAQAGLNPLRFNDTLNTSSEDHSDWMLDADQFDHQGVNGSSPHARMETAGYQFEGNWHSGESIAWMTEDGNPGYKDEVVELHNGLMNSPGHRANILNPDFTEIGIGIETGQFNDGGGELDSVMISQNFAHTDADPAVTDQPPTDPVDEVVDDVVTEEPPTDPVDEVVTNEDDSVTSDLWEMFSNMVDGFGEADNIVFASFGTATDVEDQGTLIYAETFIFIPEEFGAFQPVAAQDDTGVAQITDLGAGMQLPDTTNAASDLGICGGFDALIA